MHAEYVHDTEEVSKCLSAPSYLLRRLLPRWRRTYTSSTVLLPFRCSQYYSLEHERDHTRTTVRSRLELQGFQTFVHGQANIPRRIFQNLLPVLIVSDHPTMIVRIRLEGITDRVYLRDGTIRVYFQPGRKK